MPEKKFKSVRIKSNDVPVKQFDSVEVAENFEFKAEKIIRVNYHDESLLYILCVINGVPCVLGDVRDSFVEFVSNFVD